MVGGPEDQTPPADQTPKAEDPKPDPSPPEVEVEIVDAEFTEAPREESAPEAEPAAKAAPARGGVLRPIVIAPLALVVLLVVAFIVWRALPPKKAEPEAPATASEPQLPQEAAEPAETVEPQPAPTAPAAQEEPQEEPEALPEKLPPPDPSKILNAPSADLKAATDAIEKMKDGETTRGLPPPPPSGGANDELQRAAKDALRAFGPEAVPESTSGEAAPGAAPAQEEETTTEPEAALPPSGDDAFARLQDEAEEDAAAEEKILADQAGMRADTPPAEAAKIANDVTALKELFDSKTDRLSSELSAAREQSAELGREVASLKESLNAALSARSDRESEDLESLKAEMAKIRSDREQASAAKAAAASMALLALQQKLTSGAPYKDELERLKGFAPRAGGLEALTAHAETGVPTLGSLKTRFGPLIRETLAADRAARAKGPIAAFFARLEGLVSVRPAHPQEGASTGAVISRAEARLAADDLAGTVSELQGLEGAALETIGPWLDDAKARAGADAALAALSGSLAGQYGG
ncbi:MAG: hypothetical protein H6848_04990 [Caulobacterales bacterium]|nr:hypothetical protein [Caulobacterales bacterium]